MLDRRRLASGPSVLALAALAIVTTIASPGRAASVDLATVIMMANSEANAVFIGVQFGTDSSSPLNFTSNVDAAGQSFSYSLNPGSTYLGQAISLTSSGVLSSDGTVWTLTSDGTFGATSWSTTGTASTSTDPSGVTTDHHTYDLKDKNGNLTGDFTLDDRTITGKTSTDSGFRTDTSRKPVPNSDFTSTDSLSDGKWTFNLVPLKTSNMIFPVIGTGFSPPAGGVGTFTTTIIPEPASLILLTLGVSAVFGCLRIRAGRPS
jgi:hypothetical protein